MSSRIRLPNQRRAAAGPGPVALLLSVFAVALTACSLLPRLGDPARLPADDPRVAACGIPTAEMWMAFPMTEAREFPEHFPEWTEGADELLVAEPALVMISNGYPAPRAGGELLYDMCIAVGPPSEALIHRYGPTRFEAVRPVLGGPLVPMP